MKLLITGSSGQLGSALINELKHSEHEVTLTSRTKPKDTGNFEWIYGDFESGKGLEEAIKDVEVIVHAATSPMKNTKKIDVFAFETFLKQLGQIKHFIYPSIVGIEHIPFYYYKHKYEAETLLKKSSIPYTIVRGTQFHHFVENLLLAKPLFKKYVIPGEIKFQSVDVADFARHLLSFIDETPQRKTVEFGGPTITTLREMAEQKMKINNESTNIFSFRLPGKLYKALAEGKNTTSTQTVGKITFEDYLKNKLE